MERKIFRVLDSSIASLFCKIFSISLIVALLNSCTSNEERNYKFKKESLDEYLLNIDSLNIEKVKELDEVSKHDYLKGIGSLKELAGDYKAYFVKDFQLKNKKLLFIYVHRDSYSVIHLLVVSNKKDVIDDAVLAGSLCAGPFEDSLGIVHWCEEKYSVFNSDSTFTKTLISKSSNDYTESNLYVDSIVTKYKINLNGRIMKTDSTKSSKKRYLDMNGKEINR